MPAPGKPVQPGIMTFERGNTLRENPNKIMDYAEKAGCGQMQCLFA
jgi:hypothetical protein